MTLRYLADTSALARLRLRPPVAAVLRPLMNEHAIAVSTPVLLEVLFGARASEYRKLKMVWESVCTVLPITPEACARAAEVQSLLAHKSQHRTAGTVDLLTAACAEVNGLTVLHYDRDFDAIAAVTGQPTSWVVPAGSVA
ncbi:MAG: hypothetical protein V7603_2186 [Micromonosporaceae bacterium]|jgi:predicted nucleic acid-binding protein